MIPRLLLFSLLLVGLRLPALAQPTDGVPAKPDPFTFVTDQAHLLSEADARKLGNGLRTYAASTGTPVIVVTVPTLGGRRAANVARQIGNTWQVGQAAKNNGIVVLLSGQDHQLSIQAGSGMRGRITPAVVQQVIGQMTPDFKQNNYFGGLRTGLNTLMATANPGSAPARPAAGAAPTATGAAPMAAGAAPTATGAAPMAAGAATASTATPAPADAAATRNTAAVVTSPAPVGAAPVATPVEPVSTGLPWGSLLLGGMVLVGGFLLLRRLFGGGSAPANNQAPNFTGSQPARPMGNTPNFGAPNAPGYPLQGNYPPQAGYGAAPGGGMGSMGGILATGAAAAAGAYLGNRLGGSHDQGNAGAHNLSNDNAATPGGSHADPGADPGAGAAAAGTGAAGSYFGTDNANAATPAPGPDYFFDDSAANSGTNDYFADDTPATGDTSGNFGGGDFGSDTSDTSGSDNSGSW